MRGAQKRAEMQIEVSNRQAYNTAALTGGAMAGKLPAFEKVFGKRAAQLKSGAKQSAQALEANLRVLAIAWGAQGS